MWWQDWPAAFFAWPRKRHPLHVQCQTPSVSEMTYWAASPAAVLERASLLVQCHSRRSPLAAPAPVGSAGAAAGALDLPACVFLPILAALLAGGVAARLAGGGAFLERSAYEAGAEPCA